jgi:hypothetical protein
MLAGAALGTVLVLRVSLAAGLAAATGVLVVVTAGALAAVQRPAAWRS